MGVDVFLEDVRENVRISDVFLIGIVPVVLSFVFLLPETVQNGLMLDHQDVSVFNLWSSMLVHRGFDHFSNNVVSYCLLAVPSYLLFALADERRLFRYVFYVFLTVLPVVISVVNVLVVDANSGAGFSGVGSAFFGVLPVSLFLFVHNRFSERVDPSHAVVLFLVVAVSISLIYTGVSAVTVGIVLATVLVFVYDVYQIGVEELKTVAGDLSEENGYLELVLFSGLLFLVSPLLLFPRNIAQGSGVVNILSHYLGLALGFFLPYLYLIRRQKQEENGSGSTLFG